MDNTQRLKITPKDFFLWLGAMVSLYISVVSILTLYFQYINVLFPDQLNYYVDPYSSSIRFAIASLVVFVPLYIFLTRVINGEIREIPEKKELWVRRWLIYITLFIGGITLAADLVVLINTFLGGEITTRFLLKVLAVFVVVVSFFWYYLSDLRGVWERKPQMAHILGYAMAAVVVFSIVGGFFIIGSPMDQRLYRFDDQKSGDLQNIQWQLINYYQQKGKLPVTLDDLQDPIAGFVVPHDPQTSSSYIYEVVKAPYTFKLCATFNKDSRPQSQTAYMPAIPVGVEGKYLEDRWTHGVGETCFERTIDPDLYPIINKK